MDAYLRKGWLSRQRKQLKPRPSLNSRPPFLRFGQAKCTMRTGAIAGMAGDTEDPDNMKRVRTSSSDREFLKVLQQGSNAVRGIS